MKSFSFRGGEILRVAESKDLFTAEVKSPSPVGLSFLLRAGKIQLVFCHPLYLLGFVIYQEGRQKLVKSGQFDLSFTYF